MGFRGKLITSFAYSGRGIDLSEAEIRMMTAVFADGSFYYRSCSDTTYRKCRFHLKKERKKERLEKLIQLGNFPFRGRKKAVKMVIQIIISQFPLEQNTFLKNGMNVPKNNLQSLRMKLSIGIAISKVKTDFLPLQNQMQILYSSQ